MVVKSLSVIEFLRSPRRLTGKILPLLLCETVPVVEVFRINVHAVINDESVFRYYTYSSYRHPNFVGSIFPHEGDRSFIDVMLT